MKRLRLEVRNFTDDLAWSWRLSNADGEFIADHRVEIDVEEAESSGFRDLQAFLSWNTAPDLADGGEEALVAGIASWIRKEVWGVVGDAILEAAEQEPVVVRVEIPRAAEALLFRPLELGLVLGDADGALDVSLVYDFEGTTGSFEKHRVGNRLRILALFSMPTDQAALDLRRERRELKRLVQRVALTDGKAVELRILQYGVTREVLEETLEEGDGWDIVHFSGHGLPAGLVLEQPEGTADLIPSDEFAKLLSPTRAQLKLVTLSSCESGAAMAAHTMALLGLDGQSDSRSQGKREVAAQREAREALPAVAQDLARTLGCAALAMRYPVEDEFAISLTSHLYTGLLSSGQSLPRALQRALRKSIPPGGDRSRMGRSLATPALFGQVALDLKLTPPAGAPARFDSASSAMAFFEPESEIFVGRVGPLARASATLAPQSNRKGVVFHGMAGAGKTSCALELAYRHENRRFEAMGWYRAPSEGQSIAGALAQFAVGLETQLPGFEIAHAVESEERLRPLLPRISKLLADRSLLIVVDNVESLLTTEGAWRDPRWAILVDAFLAHDGLSRLVLTSRVPPRDLLEDERVLVESINSLSASESVLFARQLGNLGKLILGENGIAPLSSRELVRRTLELVQGNPKLIELANHQAADPVALQERITEADAAWADKADLSAFFSSGEPDADIAAQDFLKVIERWTQGIEQTLNEEQRLAFQFVNCLEANDRIEPVARRAWLGFWGQLKRPGEPPDLSATIAEIARQGLIDIEDNNGMQVYRIHPAVENAERSWADEKMQEKVDAVLSVMWNGTHTRSIEENNTRMVTYSGLHAAPYLLRLDEPKGAASLLFNAITSEGSAQILASALPLLEQAAAKAEGTPAAIRTRRALLLARAMAIQEPSSEIIAEMRDLIDLVVAEGDSEGAAVIFFDLFNELLRIRHLQEAEKVIEERAALVKRANLGPWNEFANEGMRLQVMQARGEGEEVLERFKSLRDRIPDGTGEKGEIVLPSWNVWEAIMATAHRAAINCEKWEYVLELSKEIRESMVARSASPLEMAMAEFNDYGALLELDRFDDADQLMRRVRAVVERDGDPRRLGEIFSAWADLEERRGHLSQAINFELRALRYKYMLAEPDAIIASHNNLTIYLVLADEDPQLIISHRLAIALISFQTETTEYQANLRKLISVMAKLQTDSIPGSFDSLCAQIDRIEGIDFKALFDRLPARAPNGDEALATVIQDLRVIVAQKNAELDK